MAKGKSLCDLNEGQSAVVAGIINKGAMRRRLFDLGVVAGTKISCRQKAPAATRRPMRSGEP